MVAATFIKVASTIGKLVSQLAEGQMNAIQIKYEGGLCHPHDLSGSGETPKSPMPLTVIGADATLCLRAVD